MSEQNRCQILREINSLNILKSVKNQYTLWFESIFGYWMMRMICVHPVKVLGGHSW